MKSDPARAVAILLSLCATLSAHAWTLTPGLLQAKSNSWLSWDLFAEGVDHFAASVIPIEPVPGPVMLDVKADEGNALSRPYTNPWTGSTYTWDRVNTLWSYKGQVFLSKDTTYAFAKYLDDAARIVLDGTTILENTVWDNFVTATYTPSRTGWHDILITAYDGTGGKGPYGGIWGESLGLGWNPNGSTNPDPAVAGWAPLRDPGDGSVFRCLDESANPISFRRIETTATGYCFYAAFSDPAAVGTLCVALSSTHKTIPVGGDASEWESALSASITTPGEEATFEVAWSGPAPAFAFLASGTTPSGTSFSGASPTYQAAEFQPRALSATPIANDQDAIIGATLSVGPNPLGASNTLYVAYGPLDAGDSPEAWPNLRIVATLPPEATSLDYTFPEGWGESFLAARFFLIDGTALPYDYQPDYIEATGSQYIDLDFTMVDSYTSVLSFVYTRFGGGSFFGTQAAPDDNDCRFFLYNQNPYLDYPNNNRLNSGYVVPTHTRLTYEISNYYLKDLSSNTTILQGNPISFGTHAYPLRVFASTDYGRLFFLQIFDSGTLIHDFIPVVTYEGEACLYDRATETFYYNSGAGNLLVAPRSSAPTSHHVWVDATAPLTLAAPWVENPPTIARNPDGSYTLNAFLDAGSGSLYAVYNDAITNRLATSATGPSALSETPSNLAPDTTYAYAVLATGSGLSRSISGTNTFLTGSVSLGATSNASETGLTPGSFTFLRPASATQHDLTVHYTLSGSATPGLHFADTLNGSITIPAGEASATLTVTPLLDTATQADTTLTLSLASGLYGIGDTATASLTITELAIPHGTNVWIAPAPGLASDPANWSAGYAPLPSDTVLFDGTYSSADCQWDSAAPSTVAHWIQTPSFSGTLSFDIRYPEAADATFTNLTITGSATLEGGTWTHPIAFDRPDSWTVYTPEQIRTRHIYRLAISAHSFLLGPNTSINLVGKGHSQKNTNAQACYLFSSHGGCLEDGSSIRCYGDPKFPEEVGYASNWGTDSVHKDAAGSGTLKLSVATTCTIDGEINADGEVSTGKVAAGAGGSILIEAETLTGTGSIHADGTFIGNTSYHNGTGGRIAIHTQNPVDRSALSIHASGTTQGQHAANGTVYFHDNTMNHGILRIENDSTWRGHPYSAQTTPEGDWTFDAIFLRGSTYLTIPADTTLTLPNGLASVTSTASNPGLTGVTLQGGTLDLPLGPTLLSGPWTFGSTIPFTFYGDVTLTDRTRFVGHATLPTQSDGTPGRLYTIHGRLSADSTTHIDFHGNQIRTQSATLNGIPLPAGSYTPADFPSILNDTSSEQTGELLVLGDATLILLH